MERVLWRDTDYVVNMKRMLQIHLTLQGDPKRDQMISQGLKMYIHFELLNN